MVGSANIEVTARNSSTLLVKIFNITSVTSGDLDKHFPGNDYPISSVRDQSSATATQFGNISQTFSFTIPIDFNRLNQ